MKCWDDVPPLSRLATLPDGVPKLTLGWEALAFAAEYLVHPNGPRAGKPWVYTPEQARFLLWWYALNEDGSWMFRHGVRRLGKGPISHDEVVPTPAGIRRHGDLRVGDEVYAVDGSITRVVDLGEEVHEDCYRVTFRDGTSVVCTGSHRWPVDVFIGRGKRVREIVTVRDMLDTGLYFHRPLTRGKTKCSKPNVARYRTLPTPAVEGKTRARPPRAITAIEPVETVPARCITVAHASHQYLVGESWVPTCNSGKSPFAATMALIEFCGPVRLDDFDPRLPGGCRGKRVPMPLVQIAATAESQTENTMRMVRSMAPKGSKIATEFKLDPGRTRYNMLPEGSLTVVTASAAALEGTEATFVVADETEHWLPAKGGPELHDTLMGNLAKSGSRMVETANAWRPGVGSVAETGWNAWLDEQEGRVRTDKGRILYDARMAPPDTDLADPVSLRKALEFVYEDCPWADLDAIMGRIWSPQAKPDESKRKYLNWPTVSLSSWVTPQDWAKLARPDITVAKGDRVVLFFDGSKSRDATALIGCRLSDGHVFTVGVWEPDNSHDGHSTEVNVSEVDDKVSWAMDYYDVVAFFADVKEWEGFTKVTWPQRWRDRLDLWAVPSGRNPEPIAWDMRSHVYDFSMAAELTESEILQGGFTHDGNSVLARHVANCRRQETRFGSITVKKETPNSRFKIDAAVCMIGARMAYKRALEGITEEAPQPTGAMFI